MDEPEERKLCKKTQRDEFSELEELAGDRYDWKTPEAIERDVR